MFGKPDAYAPRAETTVGSGRGEAGPHPLGVEAEALGCLVSDLRFDARLRAQTLYDLIGLTRAPTRSGSGRTRQTT